MYGISLLLVLILCSPNFLKVCFLKVNSIKQTLSLSKVNILNQDVVGKEELVLILRVAYCRQYVRSAGQIFARFIRK